MGNANSEQFYANLPVLNSFFEVSKAQNYHALPDDWYIGVTDIKDSTGAIQNNQYKRVNILGASPIIGIMNKTDRADLPYTFGGDGCAICFPKKYKQSIRQVFKSCQAIGESEYELHLRTAIIPVRKIKEEGHQIDVARFQVSPMYSQAVFTGGGINYAEDLLKEHENSPYHIKNEGDIPDIDYTGLECRWQEVHPPGKSVISILVQCNPAHSNPEKVYDRVLKKMSSTFGFDDKTNPILTSELGMHMSVPALWHETKFRTFGQGWLQRFKYVLKVELQTLLGKIFMKLGYQSSKTDWTHYKSDLSLNSDHRKFDDMLRLVIQADQQQQEEFVYPSK